MRALRGEGRDDFREHREYVPGDDLRRIDWNLLGRLGELHTKHFEARVDIELHVFLDRSASMRAVSSRERGQSSKDVAGRRLAGALAAAGADPGRSVIVHAGTTVCSARNEKEVARMFETLEGLPVVSGPESFPDLSAARAPSAPGRSRLFVFSTDMLGSARRGRFLDGVVGAGDRAVVVAWSTDAERSPATGRSLRLRGLEDEATLDLVPDAEMHARYLEARRKWRVEIEAEVSRRGAVFLELEVETPVEEAARALFRAADRPAGPGGGGR